MNAKAKFFRLINAREMTVWRENFSNRLDEWNENHALFPLTCNVTQARTMTQDLTQTWLFSNEEQPIVLMQQDIVCLKECLFGEQDQCFDAVSERLLTELIKTLTQTEEITQETQPFAHLQPEAWFYPGSPTLALTLTARSAAILLYFHPQWVLQHVARPKHTLQTKTNLEEALAEQTLHCGVELKSFTLPLKTALDLQAGDVIKTDHRLDDPALLMHQNALFQVALGAINCQKSIKIESVL